MLQGLLYKEGHGIFRRYKKRWFVLGEGDKCIRYYSSRQSGSLRGQIDLEVILSVDASLEEAQNKRNCFGFTITTDKQVIRLFAVNSLERGYWMDGINRRMTEYRSGVKKRISFKHIHFTTMPHLKLPAQFSKGADVRTPNTNNEENKNKKNNNNNRMIIKRSKSESSVRVQFDRTVSITLSNDPSVSFIQDEDSFPSPRSTPDVRERDKEDVEMLLQRIKELEKECDDQRSQIAALASFAEKPPSSKAAAKRRSRGITNNERKGKVQEEINQFVGIGMWLEQKKKDTLESEVTELNDKLQDAATDLEQERKKVAHLEETQQDLLEQVKRLNEENKKLYSLIEKVGVRKDRVNSS